MHCWHGFLHCICKKDNLLTKTKKDTMKKIIALLGLACMLYADAKADCKCTSGRSLKRKTVSVHHGYSKKNICSATKMKRKTVSAHLGYKKVAAPMKREIVSTYYGYRELPTVEKTIIYHPLRDDDGASVDPNSGIGRNSSDNFHGLVNNGSMGANGMFQHGTCEMWISSLDERSSEADVAQAAGKCYR